MCKDKEDKNNPSFKIVINIIITIMHPFSFTKPIIMNLTISILYGSVRSERQGIKAARYLEYKHRYPAFIKLKHILAKLLIFNNKTFSHADSTF